jgi:RND family efflux transporter MFP subunit
MKKFFSFFARHKVVDAIIIIAIIVAGYYSYQAWTNQPQPTHYVLAKAANGSVIATVSGTGQIAATNQLDVKAQASGNIVSVAVNAGDTVKNGQLLATIDNTDALKTVRDAEANLESAKLSLQQLTAPADALTLLQAQNAVTDAQNSKTQTQTDLGTEYSNALNEISNSFIDFPDVMSGLQARLYDNNMNSQQNNSDYMADIAKVYDPAADTFRDSANSDYTAARTAYDANFLDYKNVSRTADPATIENILNETYKTSQLISQAVQSASNLVQFYSDRLNEHGLTPLPLASTYLSDLNGYTGKINGHLTNLLNYQQTIASDKQAISDADRTIAEKTASLSELQAGPTALQIQSSQLSVTQKQNALSDAESTLANYYIRAPFDGIIATLDVKKGDSISNGGTAATIITKQLSSTISLNEVDAVKVKIGDKVTITFDAISGLTITGTVSQMDTIGTVSQGVVNYNILVVFDTQDTRVRSGMSVTASIITDSHQDVIVVPSTAIKTANGTSYVLVPNETVTDIGNSRTGVVLTGAPVQAAVTTGLSDNQNTEITSGLSEGQVYVVKTIVASGATAAASTTRSIIPTGGGARVGGAGGGFAPTGR